MKYNLIGEIHLFHTSRIYLSEYPIKVKQLRTKINEVSKIEMQHLDILLENNKITFYEYEKLKEIVMFKRSKYQEMVNQI